MGKKSENFDFWLIQLIKFFFSMLLISIMVSLVLHWITPVAYHYLNQTQISKIYATLFGIAVVIVVKKLINLINE